MADPVKVLFAIGTLDLGGAERQLVELASGMDRARFEPIVCVLGEDGPLGPMLRERGVQLHCLGFRGFRTGGRIHVFTAARALFRLWRIMRHERPAIFHGVLFWAYITGTLVARIAGVPVVIASRRSLGLFKAHKRHYLLLERLVNRMTDLFIANSDAVRRDVLTQEGIPANRIIVIHNGLEVARYRRNPTPALREELQLGPGPVVVLVSNFIEYKGHQYFFAAWRRILVRYPTAVAVLVGEGTTRAEWETRSQREGWAQSVRFVAARRDVPVILGLADLFVHPSLQEGYSNAVLEAMACSLPVVATAVGGTVEAIEHEQTGLLVPAGDASALEHAVMRLLDDPALALRLGTSARRRAEERFQLAGMIRQYEEVYARFGAATAQRREQDYVRNRRAV